MVGTFKRIAYKKLGSGEASNDIDTGEWTGDYDRLKVRIFLTQDSGNQNPEITFNNTDSGYGFKYGINNANGVDVNGSNYLYYFADDNGDKYITMDIINIKTKEKNVFARTTWSASGDNAPSHGWLSGKWSNTSSSIKQIELKNAFTGNFGVGSYIIVLGASDDVVSDEKTTLADATVTTSPTPTPTSSGGTVSLTSGGSNVMATTALGFTASNTWVLRFSTVFTDYDANSYWNACLSSSDGNTATAQNYLGCLFRKDGSQNFGVHNVSNGSAPNSVNSSPQQAFTNDSSSTYYWEIIRQGATSCKVNFYGTDSTYGTVTSSSENTSVANATGLNRIKFMSDASTNNTGSITIGNVKFYNGITAVTSTTTSLAPPANTRYEETDTRKIYRFTSSGTQSNTLGSDGDATNNGADLNTTDQKLGTGCLDFETGNGDYINATDLLTNNAMGSTGTISFWIKPESLNGAYMWSVGDSNGTSSRIYIEQQSTSLWTVFCQISGASQWKVDSTGVSFSTGTWYHVVITHDGGSSYGAVKLYINGVDRSSNSNNGTTWNKWVGDLSGLDNMAFGRHHHNNLVYTQKSDGLMDDMGVWNRALTQAEVTSLYNSGTGRTCNTIPSGLRAYYDCNSATVTNNTNAFTAWKERGSA